MNPLSVEDCKSILFPINSFISVINIVTISHTLPLDLAANLTYFIAGLLVEV